MLPSWRAKPSFLRVRRGNASVQRERQLSRRKMWCEFPLPPRAHTDRIVREDSRLKIESLPRHANWIFATSLASYSPRGCFWRHQRQPPHFPQSRTLLLVRGIEDQGFTSTVRKDKTLPADAVPAIPVGPTVKHKPRYPHINSTQL